MKVTVVLALLLASVPAVSSVHGDRTMTKVVKMLQDMLKKSQEDGEKDRDLYAKFKCYCDDNEADKKEAIAEYKKEIKMLENEIADIQAATGELSTECAQLKQDIADNEQARADAQSARDKAHEDFVAEEKDMTGAIEQMGEAIDTLAAVGADQTQSLLTQKQFMGKKSLLKLKASVKEAMSAVSVLLTQKQRRSLESFLQAPFTGTYTSQSGEIVGILKNMRDTFKANLASARSAEKAAQEAHEKFMKIKEEEYDTMKAAYEEKQAKLGENDESLASLRESKESMEAELANDEEFLAKLLVMCAKKAKEFEERKVLRANEEAAISQAVAILNSDAAFESFGKVKSTKSGGTGLALVQIGQHTEHVSVRETVRRLMQKAARTQKSLKIARIAVLLEADNPFTTVLDEIAKMIKLIDEEQKADEEQKEWCETERDENHKKKEEKEKKVEDLKAKIEGLVDTIDNPETGLKVQIKQTEDDLKKNHDDQVAETGSRAEENKAYQVEIKNVVSAEGILRKAIKVLKAYYDQFEKEEEKELLQEEPAPPETFEGEEGDGGYSGQRDAGGEVIGMLEFIVKETNKEEQEAHMSEEEAQHDYEDSMASLKKEQADMSESLATLQDQLAEAEKTLGETRENLAVTEKELKAVERYLLKIKPGCDYIAENFDTRTENRGKEKEALEKAIELLKGTPAYKSAVNAAEQEALGDCKDICNAEGQDHAKCKACLAGVSVPGYCAGHKDTAGC